MYIFKLHGKEYKVRFTYRTLCEGDILDKVTNPLDEEDLATPRLIVNKMARTTAELLLAGLQKYHSKEFGYKTDETREERIDQLIDLFDDYEDEATEDNPQSAFTLYSDLQEELRKNGFLSAMLSNQERMEEAQAIASQVQQEMAEKPLVEVRTIKPTENT